MSLTLCGERHAQRFEPAPRSLWQRVSRRSVEPHVVLEGLVSATPTIRLRDAPPRTVWALEQAGVHPLLARLFAGRGVRDASELDDGLALLLAPGDLRGAGRCGTLPGRCDRCRQAHLHRRRLRLRWRDRLRPSRCAAWRCSARRARICCTSCPIARVHGYGLTPAIVDLALGRGAEVLVTVDNGIASLEGVAHAKTRGLAVLVTDHHLPGRADDSDGVMRIVLPEADVIVNPNQPGCAFASKNLAGVGVMFYVLLALRSELRARGTLRDRRAAAS